MSVAELQTSIQHKNVEKEKKLKPKCQSFIDFYSITDNDDNDDKQQIQTCITYKIVIVTGLFASNYYYRDKRTLIKTNHKMYVC